MNPSEKVIFDRIVALPPKGRKTLVRRVRTAALRNRFYFKKRDQIPVGLVPFVLDKRRRTDIRNVTRSVFRLQLKAPELFRSNYRGFADTFRLESKTRSWFDRPEKLRTRQQHMIRPDFGMWERDGTMTPVLFEINSLMLGGLYIQSAALKIVGECILPYLKVRPKALGIEPSVDLLVFLKRWLQKGIRSVGTPKGGGIAFLEDLPPGGGFSELPRITDFFQRQGIRALHGDPRELRLRGEKVYLRNMPVAYAYRDFSYEDTGGPRNPRLDAYRRLWDQGRVAPGFPADFDQKGILECFSSEEFAGLFSRSEAQRFKGHIPWTRVLFERKSTCRDGRRRDLPRYALRAREQLVIKPSWLSGGDGIIIGRNAKPDRWERAIEKAIKKPGAFSLQEHIENPPRPTAFLRGGQVQIKDCRFTIGTFFDGSEFGYHLRVSPKEIVNVAKGGALAPLYLC